MTSRRGLMTGAVGLMVGLPGCAGLLSEETVVADLVLTADEETAVRTVIRNAADDILYDEEFTVEPSEDQPGVSEQAVVNGEHDDEFTLVVDVLDSDVNTEESFVLDCPEDRRDDGLTVNATVAVRIDGGEEITVSESQCA